MSNWMILFATLSTAAPAVAFFVILTADLVDHRLNPIRDYVSSIAIGVWRPASNIFFTASTVASCLVAVELGGQQIKAWKYFDIPIIALVYAGVCFFVLNFFVTDREGSKRQTPHGQAHSWCTGGGVVFALVSMIAVTVWSWTAAKAFFVSGLACTILAIVSFICFFVLRPAVNSPRVKAMPTLHRVTSYTHNPKAGAIPNAMNVIRQAQPIGLAERGMIFGYFLWMFLLSESFLTKAWAKRLPERNLPDFLQEACRSHHYPAVIIVLTALTILVAIIEVMFANGTAKNNPRNFSSILRLQWGWLPKFTNSDKIRAITANTWDIVFIALYVGTLTIGLIRATPMLVKYLPAAIAPTSLWRLPGFAGLFDLIQDGGTLLLLRGFQSVIVRLTTAIATLGTYLLLYGSILLTAYVYLMHALGR